MFLKRVEVDHGDNSIYSKLFEPEDVRWRVYKINIKGLEGCQNDIRNPEPFCNWLTSLCFGGNGDICEHGFCRAKEVFNEQNKINKIEDVKTKDCFLSVTLVEWLVNDRWNCEILIDGCKKYYVAFYVMSEKGTTIDTITSSI